MKPHPHLRYRAGEGWIEAWHREQRIACAEALRDGDWILRRSVAQSHTPGLSEPANSLHPDREAARMELVFWARAWAWRHDRWPYGRNPVAKALRARP